MKITFQDDAHHVEHHPNKILVVVSKCRGCPYRRKNATICGKTGDTTDPETLPASCPLPTHKAKP